MTDLFTVKDATTRSTLWLKERGIPAPRLDAELLLAFVLGCERIQLFMEPGRPLTDDERTRYRALIQRRGDHEPVAYLVGSTGFWDIEVAVDRRALIPRPDTEKIIEVVLAAAKDKRDAPLRIVDVGCGSGILAIALAKIFPQAQVVALDISQDALDLTAENAERNEVRARIHPVLGDLLEPLIQRGSKADIIVSNPPYIGENERHLMSPGVEAHEPYRALFAGEDGFAIIDRLLPQIPHTLDTGGLFVMEFGAPQGAGIRQRVEKRFRSWRIERDYGDNDRVLVIDAPGPRSWSGEAPQTPTSNDEVSAHDPAWPTAQHTEEIAESIEGEHAFNIQGRYGGADGTELLPEIDLNDDLDR